MKEARPVDAINGGAVEIRYAAATDLPALKAFVRDLSTPTRASRFFVPVAELPEMLAHALTRGDPKHRFLIAEAARRDGHPDAADAGSAGRRIVALAQAARDREADRVCNIAIVVADGWQRNGLGRSLLQCLLDDQRHEGMVAAVGEVLRHNRAMIALARQAGFVLRRHPDDATLVRIVRPLRPAEPDGEVPGACRSAGRDRVIRDRQPA